MATNHIPIGIRVPPDLADWLRKQAEQNHRSLSNQTAWLIAQARQQQGQAQ